MRSVRPLAAGLAPALVILLFTAVVAAAQETSASLHGRVTDVAGRGVKDAIVTAQSADLIRSATTHTGASGHYAFADLPAGHYIIGFAHEGLVPVKYQFKITAGESVVANVTMRPQDGNRPAITVEIARPWPPPSWATSLESRHDALDQLPVTGGVRSALGLVTDYPTARPDDALFLFDGLPLRYGWHFASPVSFIGPGAESIQEVTVVPGRLPADYGRASAGAIMAVTRSGSNRLSGSLRAILDPADTGADVLRSARDTDGIGSSLEYGLGGALWADHTWFYASGRNVRQSVADYTAFTQTLFTTDTSERFGTAKVTHVFAPRQRLEGQWIGVRQELGNGIPDGAWRVADERALGGRSLSETVFSGAYFGHFGLDVTARYTHEVGTSSADGLPSSDALSLRTPLVDQQTGVAWWAPGTCSSCRSERSTHSTARVTLGGRLGSHYFTAGYEHARDVLDSESQPTGGGFVVRATRPRVENGFVVPVFVPNGSTWIVWTPAGDRDLRLRSEGLFLGDRWSAGRHLEIDLGVRVDRHRATAEPGGLTTISEQFVSPRVSATWRPVERLPWTVVGGYGRYVGSALDRRLDASLALQPQTRAFAYAGPSVNTTGALVPSAEALDRLFQWFQSTGGTSRAPSFVIEPGGTTVAAARIDPPHVDEWSLGVTRPIGTQGSARVDFTVRNYANLPSRQIDVSAPVVDGFGRAIDSGPAVTSNLLERRYAGMTLQASYRFGHYADVDAQYTYSQLRGNADGRMLTANGFANSELAYPQFFDAAWHLPTGALTEDSPHRLRMWAHSEIIANEKRGVLIATIVYSRESGRPYGAVGLVNVQPYVTNPGYFQPPAAVDYFFTARDAFRTEGLSRWDLGINYRRRLPGTVHGDMFGAIHILNLTNAVRVLNAERRAVTRTAFTDSSLQPFNPFTQSPVPGVHWSFDDTATRLDTAQTSVSTTLGRAIRFTLGIRF